MTENLQRLIVWGEERGHVVKLFTEGNNWVCNVGPISGDAGELYMAVARAVARMELQL